MVGATTQELALQVELVLEGEQREAVDDMLVARVHFALDFRLVVRLGRGRDLFNVVIVVASLFFFFSLLLFAAAAVFFPDSRVSSSSALSSSTVWCSSSAGFKDPCFYSTSSSGSTMREIMGVVDTLFGLVDEGNMTASAK